MVVLMSRLPRSIFVFTAGVVVACGTFFTAWAQQPAAPHVVRVTAERFAFAPSELTVPHGTTIEFHLKSEDTAHGFRIIGHGVDVTIPKRGRGEATVTFTPPEPGRYVFECSRMCGAGHSFMRGVLRVKAAGEGRR
jgi:cytochrome c oxidase subunit 2